METIGYEEKGLRTIAELMCVAARTAPKGHGWDNVETLIIDGETKTNVAAEMRRIGEEHNAGFFVRDAGCLEQAPVAIVIGTANQTYGIPFCGYCGFGDCAGCEKAGGRCHFAIHDLGVAVASAVSTAALHHADNRVMYSLGRACISLGLFGKGIVCAHGIPLSATGKNPFFDRK